MISYLLYMVVAAIILIPIFFIAAITALCFVKESPVVLRHLPSGLYVCHYASDGDVASDIRARHLASISHYGYTATFFIDYYEPLYHARLPVNVLLSWARTISEDLMCNPAPEVRVNFWNAYFYNVRWYKMRAYHPHMLDFQPHERAYLWGVVYFWLRCFIPVGTVSTSLLEYIDRKSCRYGYVRPYFDYFKKQSEEYLNNQTRMNNDEKTNIVSAIMRSGKVEIGQFVVENNGTMTNHQYATTEHSVPSARFPASIGYEHGAEKLILLKERGFVPSSTDPSVFLYQMGCTDECPQQLSPIVWLKNKQLLREMLELWFRRLIADKALSKARIEEICPQVFVGEDGLQLSLAKPKPVPSLESDVLKKFFATV